MCKSKFIYFLETKALGDYEPESSCAVEWDIEGEPVSQSVYDKIQSTETLGKGERGWT